MFRITITKSPSVRLFDRMPMPRTIKVKSMTLARRSLAKYQSNPFQRRITKIA